MSVNLYVFSAEIHRRPFIKRQLETAFNKDTVNRKILRQVIFARIAILKYSPIIFFRVFE